MQALRGGKGSDLEARLHPVQKVALACTRHLLSRCQLL